MFGVSTFSLKKTLRFLFFFEFFSHFRVNCYMIFDINWRKFMLCWCNPNRTTIDNLQSFTVHCIHRNRLFYKSFILQFLGRKRIILQ
ncbi:dubious [Schizosaccharomyces pombe]|uniref:Putative uncharacterized protein C4H3.17 n=1 Tax=Schizosaccharomyces pombe (strain 972 / ATCC 24843) TaxID=284812 RepID=YAYH_SCHPO|nr:uncharacterized protein SPAC4H3.17 [Schizosaccharomyces pombe]G2TRM9.1 RecName: Full=Putative uncharacterized protein C4H3.17 [Schizosaccharomyces pombe 972h-]CCD31331.1 dubious [Schizosaccharomyces pombe]|eukprot:NP_001343121.1 uncharacterized protein SPAC4H3.17 [Schizosaccharomyces pombe]